jgi:hypothetical protein
LELRAWVHASGVKEQELFVRIISIYFAAAASLLVASSASANMLVNGGLELNPALHVVQPDNLFYASFNYYSNALPGWSITNASTGGSIDIIPSSYFQGTQGNYCVDLVGTPNKVGGGDGIGAIEQSIATTPGNHYTLDFDLTVNPQDMTFERLSNKAMQVDITSAGTAVIPTQTFLIPIGSREPGDLQWTSQSFTFVATDSLTTIRFAARRPTGLLSSIDTFYCGPLLDNIDLIDNGSGLPSAPEPASLSVFGAGLVLLLGRARRK